jgi:hypothetical protein
MEIVPPIAEKWTFCVRFAFQNAGSVPDFEFLRNAALTVNRFGPPPIQRQFWHTNRLIVELACSALMKK